MLDKTDAASARLVTAEPLAHLAKDGRPHALREHLESVGDLAARFGDAFRAADWARLAGRWHDLGKYADDFQYRIRVENDFAAHIEELAVAERDHSSAGAVHALKLGQAAAPLAFVIAGHHSGLADASALFRERLPRKGERYASALRHAPPDLLDGVLPPLPAFPGSFDEQRRALELWIRLLFSALCDADFLDTERFYNPERASLRERRMDLSALSTTLNEQLERLEATAPATTVNAVRAQVRSACHAAAAGEPGVFSLTVPTGGGKTLASLHFALRHAVIHGKRRVVVAIPFTSIIEQTAGAYRRALRSEGAVLEHHSNLDPQQETPETRVATENWDAPIIVTTTVQLLESLFSNRSSSCRKLHRLAGSVIILDEAQALRLGALAPALDVLQALVRDHGVTLVVCTATQPAWLRSNLLPTGFPAIREIAPSPVAAFELLRRVTVRWPSASEPITYPALAAELARESDALAIVHRRRDAHELCSAVDAILGNSTTAHLSALMCPEHRSRILDSVRSAKARGLPVRLVATQLVEAGVDLDFPVVYRAMAGLDALAQAAGRCNREGQRGTGDFRVFHAPTPPPPGVLASGLAVARGMLASDPHLDVFAPETQRRYFELLLGLQALDSDDVQSHRRQLNFREVARRFRIIDNDWSAPVVVPWGDGSARVGELRRSGVSRERLRRLQRFIVLVSRRSLARWLERGAAELVEGVACLKERWAAAYDDRFGLLPDRIDVDDAEE